MYYHTSTSATFQDKTYQSGDNHILRTRTWVVAAAHSLPVGENRMAVVWMLGRVDLEPSPPAFRTLAPKEK